MTEKMQVRRAQSRKAVFVRCRLKYNVAYRHNGADNYLISISNRDILYYHQCILQINLLLNIKRCEQII